MYPMSPIAASHTPHHGIVPDRKRRTIQKTSAWTRAVTMSPWVLDGRDRRTPGVSRTNNREVVRRSYIYENGT